MSGTDFHQKLSPPEYASRFQFLKLSFPYPHVLHVELNRFWREYGVAFSMIAQDADVRVVVLSSAVKKAFSAGVDLSFLQSLPNTSDPGRRALAIRSTIFEFQNAIGAPQRCPQPVIAAVHGLAIGLGVDILSACDIRWAAADAVFSIKEVDVGLAADIGTLARLPKLTGNASLLLELALTARNFGPEEATQVGMVSKVVPGSHDEVVGAALEFAKGITAKSPIAVAGTKHLIAHARDHTIQENLDYTAIWNASMTQAPDMGDAARAALKREKVAFAPLGKTNAKL
ncbi:hypothetical protein EVG20_g4239 [Dentipellis fragilis]|uniref:Enoyl-CoA hydratase n=1 Tax=Dentipellis fragilis TaxID=205917 RepID=A0A4Y9YYM2_9AGAM|nr:hypothetical protein EVG20_g4239 [Dentipellis fragilis]